MQTRLTFGASFRLTSAVSPGQGAGAGLASRSAVITLAAGNNPQISPGDAVAPWPQERIMTASLFYTLNAGGGVSGVAAYTWRGLEGWIVNGAGIVPGTSAGFVPNAAGDSAIEEEATILSDYRDVLRISGAAATALGNFAGAGLLSVEMGVSRSQYDNAPTDAWLDLFADDTIGDTLPNVLPLAARSMAQLKARGAGRLVLAASGTSEIAVVGCAGAYGWRNPIVLAADIGLGFGQIAADKATWNASMFAPHPRAFVRSATAIHQLQLIGPTDSTVTQDYPPVTSDLALAPLTAAAATFSVWRLLIKGNACTVILSHNGLDVRRPRDIWNQVLVPAMNRGATPTPIYGYRYGLNQKQFFPIGQLEELEYLDYALCLDLLSSAATPVLTLP
jgi:hypothetical protein